MSIQLRRTASALIEEALAATGGSVWTVGPATCRPAERAAEREGRFFSFRREGHGEAPARPVPARPTRAMA